MFVRYGSQFSTAYRQGTYGVANFLMQVTDVVNVLAIGEISIQPVE